MTISAVVSPLKRALQSAIQNAVKNKLFTTIYNIKAKPSVVSLPHFRNELVYNPATWAEWVKSANVVGDVTGLEFTADGANWFEATLVGNYKVSTKYGILYNVVSSTLTQPLYAGGSGYPFNGTPISRTVGNNKVVLTSTAAITTNKTRFSVSATDTLGSKIKIRDIRIFELPLNSEIEADFTNLSADALMAKYNPGVIAPGDLRATVVGRTLKNELDYTPATWAEWGLSSLGTGGFAVDSSSLEFTADGTNYRSANLNTLLKGSTKYGLLVNVVTHTATADTFKQDVNGYYGAGAQSINFAGMWKRVFTTGSNITYNRCQFYYGSDTAGNKIKIKDIRLFELPAGSEIESDFTNMTADQLAIKYPMAIGSDGRTGGVKSVGHVATNLFTNSDYRYGTAGWVTGGYATLSFDGVLFITGNGTNSFPRAGQVCLSYKEGKKVYVKCVGKVTNSDCAGFVAIAVTPGMVSQVVTMQNSPVKNVEYTCSAIATLTSGGSGNTTIFVAHQYSAVSAIDKVMEVKKVMAIDLTRDFAAGITGTGLEPDLATCDRIFADWFDGSKSIMRARSVGKNLFNKSKSPVYTSASTSVSVFQNGIKVKNSVAFTYYRAIFTQVLKPNTKYTVSYFATEISGGQTTRCNFNITAYELGLPSSALPAVLASASVEGSVVRSFTTTATGKIYIIFFASFSDAVATENLFDNIVIEESPVSTAYEPYREATCIIPTDLKSVGNVADSFDASAGILTKRVSDWVNLQNYTFGRNSSADTTNYWSIVSNNVIDIVGTGSLAKDMYNLSNYNGKSIDWATYISTDSDASYISGYRLYIKIPKAEILDTIDNAKAQAWLTSKGIKMIYQLASPEVKKYEPVLLCNGLKAERGGTLYVEKVDGSSLGVVPNLQLQYERSV